MKRSLRGASLEEAGCAVRRPFVRRQARPGWVSVDFAELWHYRELLLFQVLRGIKVRYKRTALGAAWAILQPVLTMAAFTIFFGRLAGVPSDVSQPGPAALSNEAVARLRQQSGERENRIGHAVGYVQYKR